MLLLVSDRMTHESDRYILGTSAAEIQHLVAQAEVYAAEAEQLLDLVGLVPGARAIDLGCGVMGILHLLSRRVGDEGRVVGLDREARILEVAKTLAQEHGLRIDFIEADATETGLPADSFDFVHARTLLVTVNRPDEIIREMVRLARAGGTVAVEEPDTASWVCDPPHPTWRILRDAVRGAYRRTGKDLDIGRRTARMLREAGLEDVAVRATVRVTKLGDYYQTFLLTMVQLVWNVILEAGELTEDRLQSYAALLRTHLEAPGTITCQPVMWQAWGRKAA